MSTLVSPVVGRRTSKYGPRKAPTAGATTFHRGTDHADDDDIIVSPAAGVVVAARYAEGRGNYVQVDIGRGVRVLVQHLASIAVKVGQRVTAGQRLGIEGRTGTATGVHCHTEVTVNGVHVDPEVWFKNNGVTLGSTGTGRWVVSTEGTTMANAPVMNWTTESAAYSEQDAVIQGILIARKRPDGTPYYRGSIDGLRGPLSLDGLGDFQDDYNCGGAKGNPDLMIGPRTWESLLTDKKW